MKRLNMVIAVFFFIMTCGVFAQNKTQKIDELVRGYVNAGEIHGVVLVAEESKVIYTKAFGLANMEWDVPNQTTSRFRIYSMSKQFTAMLIMQLVEKGKIELEESISTYLPYYRKDVGDKVTVHHLLTHTHGIAEGYDRLPPFLVPEPTRELVEKYLSNDLDFEPGSQYRYSGLLGYILLGAIIESVTGKSFEDVLQENILDPLKMVNTMYLNYHKIIKNRADDYSRTDTGFEHRIQAYPVHADGASGIVSTVDDLLIWDQALYSDRLISKKYKEILFKSHVQSREPAYGYGWYIDNLDINRENKTIFFHTGGSSCIIFRSVEDRHTVILLNNIRSRRLFNISIEILRLLLSVD